MINTIVVIGGGLYSGKTTVGNTLVKLLDERELDFYRYALATPIKELVCQYYGISQEELEREKSKYRCDLQQLGTEAGRNTFKNDLWIRILIYRLNLFGGENGGNFIIDDVRFPNEVEALRDCCTNFIGVWVDTPEEDRAQRHKGGIADYAEAVAHSSEQSLDGSEPYWAYRLYNDNGSTQSEETLEFRLSPIVNKLNMMIKS